MRSAGRVLAIVALLIALVAVPLIRSGALDFTGPQGMVGDPCHATRELRSGLGGFLLGAGERERLQDWAGLCRFRADNARLIASGRRPRVVMIGDSITEYWRELDPAFFAEGVIDRGLGGQTSAQVLLRFEQDVVVLRPRTVHILVGLNDIAGNTGLNRPEDFQANVRAMTAIAKANDIKVVLGSLPPATGFYWRKGIDPRPCITELNGWLQDHAAKQGHAFANYHVVLADAYGNPEPGFADDGIHPTPAAYAAMRPIALAAFAEAEQGAKPASSGPDSETRASISCTLR